MLLRRELRKACLHAFHNRAAKHCACAEVVKARVAKTFFFAVILNDKVVKDPVIFLFG